MRGLGVVGGGISRRASHGSAGSRSVNLTSVHPSMRRPTAFRRRLADFSTPTRAKCWLSRRLRQERPHRWLMREFPSFVPPQWLDGVVTVGILSPAGHKRQCRGFLAQTGTRLRAHCDRRQLVGEPVRGIHHRNVRAPRLPRNGARGWSRRAVDHPSAKNVIRRPRDERRLVEFRQPGGDCGGDLWCAAIA